MTWAQAQAARAATGLAAAAGWARKVFDLRTLQFYGGVVLVGLGFGWGVAGAVLAAHAVVVPLLVRRGGTA